MSFQGYTRRCQVSLLVLFLTLAALGCVYLAVLARPTSPALDARRQHSLHLLNGESNRLTVSQNMPCVPPDWPVGVVHPHIFIVGHSKTGSTYIHALLTQHPKIVTAKKKEINFFPATGIADPVQAYARYFPKRSPTIPDEISIDASVGYVREPLVRDMLRQTFPCAKIIFLMRDPTVRWWSGYNFVQRRCQASKNRKECRQASVEEHYAVEMDRMRHSFEQVGFTKEVQEAGVSYFSLQRQKLPIEEIGQQTLTTGMYYSRIMEWLEVWPREQILLVNSDEYFDPATLNDRMRIITDFVGLEPFTFKPLPPKLPASNTDHTAPGDYGSLPEPYNTNIRAFYEPDLKLLKEHFGISFNATAGDGGG